MAPIVRYLRYVVICVSSVALACGPTTRKPERVWGKRGVLDGDLVRPRAAAIDGDGRLFIVDFTARIQVFSLDGEYLGPTWTPPDHRNGRPSGLGIDRHGNLIVCDSHYYILRFYRVDGTEIRTIGGKHLGFGYLSDAVQDDDGYIYVAEFGDHDRISKLTEEGALVAQWGRSGDSPGKLNRARALALGPDRCLYVADACNHRIQVFTRDGEFVRCFGRAGNGPGEFQYPYDLAFDSAGALFVVERGNCRVQKLTIDGAPISSWGSAGRRPGEFNDPWALAVDALGRVHVIDTENHRVQRFDP